MKRLFILFITNILLLCLISCGKKEKESLDETFLSYETVIDIDDDLKDIIESAYLKEFNEEIKWSNPINYDSFNTIDELNDFRESNYGFRIYGKFGDTYVLCGFRYSSIAQIYYSINYDEVNSILDNSWNKEFGTEFYQTLLFKNGEFINYKIDSLGNKAINMSNVILLEYVNIKYEDALKIKVANYNYVEKYYRKYMTDSDKDSQSAYTRIVYELTGKSVLS